jgi:hypothetical protein
MTWKPYRGKNAATLDRADFLVRNRERLLELMDQSGVADPVGIVADLRDHHAQQLALAMGWDDGRIERELAEYKVKKQIPTFTVVVPFADAEKIMPFTSPTATESLTKAKAVIDAGPGRKLIIGIMAKGNSYAVV